MYIKKFQIENYKGFLKTAEIDLGPGINVVCGANNAGKTAVLEALAPDAQSNPHRSPKTVPSPRIHPRSTSWVNLSVSITGKELVEMMREQGSGQYRVPAPNPAGGLGRQLDYTRNHIPSAQRLLEWIFDQQELVFHLQRQFGGQWKSARFPSFGLYDLDSGMSPPGLVAFTVADDGSPDGFVFGQDKSYVDLGVQITPAIATRIYRFTAERMNIGLCPFGDSPVLSPNASDLPRVLNILQANESRFAKFNRLLRDIFPQIRRVSVHPVGNQVEIRVWTFDPALEREDLTVPLAQCGTGLGQVMAILYVVLFATSPQVILIDEPQSFLHPGAVRKLLEVLKSYPKHQFLIATHSPTVISAAEPDTITMVKTTDGESSLEPIDPDDAKSLQLYLAEVGARLADVFGADRILWVEGATEELCFPLILERVAKFRLRGTCILSVCNTGDLETRDANRVFDMYNRLSDRNSLLPPAVGFILDSECHSDEAKIELIRRSKDLLRFLPRRMYENYLLNSHAIAAVANRIDGFRNAALSADEVAPLIEEMKANRRYFCPAQMDVGEWRRDINGAQVLQDIFARLSENRVRFDKVVHSVALTEWLIENAPEELQPVAEVILERLQRDAKPVSPAAAARRQLA